MKARASLPIRLISLSATCLLVVMSSSQDCVLLFDKETGSFTLERISDTIHVKHRRPMKAAAEAKAGARESTSPAAAVITASKSPTPPPPALSLEDELAMSADEDDEE